MREDDEACRLHEERWHFLGYWTSQGFGGVTTHHSEEVFLTASASG